jgi:type I site-specific restriction endonuclease
MESERETRKRRIDPHLKAAGWTIVPFSPTLRLPVDENLAIEEYPTANGPADYAVSINGEIVGVVEAKKVTRSKLDSQQLPLRTRRLISRTLFIATNTSARFRKAFSLIMML